MPPPRELVMMRCSSASRAWTSSATAVGCRSETMCPLADRSCNGRYGVQPSGAVCSARSAASRLAWSRIEVSPIPVRSLMEADSPGPQRAEDLRLCLIRQMQVAVLSHLGQEPGTCLQRSAGYQAERRLIQVGAAGQSGILFSIDQGTHGRSFAAV